MNNHTFFAVMRLFFHKVSVIFNTLLSVLSKMLSTRVVKLPVSTSEHITSSTRKLLTNCDNASAEFILTKTWKMYFSPWQCPASHQLAHTHEAIANVGWTVLSHLANSPDLAPSNYHLLGPVRVAVHDVILQITTNWNKVFVMCWWWWVKAGNFTTLVYSILLIIRKSMLKMMETLWKNSLIIGKDVWIIHINFIVIAFTFSEKKIGGFMFVPSIIHSLCS
jgi:hypothetical protein